MQVAPLRLRSLETLDAKAGLDLDYSGRPGVPTSPDHLAQYTRREDDQQLISDSS
jgi:hypothetical protein